MKPPADWRTYRVTLAFLSPVEFRAADQAQALAVAAHRAGRPTPTGEYYTEPGLLLVKRGGVVLARIEQAP